MLLCCLKCRQNTKGKNQKLQGQKRKNNAFIKMSSACDTEKLKFIKKHVANRLSSSSGIKTSLSKIPLLGPLLF